MPTRQQRPIAGALGRLQSITAVLESVRLNGTDSRLEDDLEIWQIDYLSKAANATELAAIAFKTGLLFHRIALATDRHEIVLTARLGSDSTGPGFQAISASPIAENMALRSLRFRSDDASRPSGCACCGFLAYDFVRYVQQRGARRGDDLRPARPPDHLESMQVHTASDVILALAPHADS